MKHKILYGNVEQVQDKLKKIELDWDIEVVSSSIGDILYTVIVKILRPKY
jgi:hypothetical protein|tara:strand:+ start:4731 stop:4880 length:150 start_codon:yes stop_codon:yes gene_type:complete